MIVSLLVLQKLGKDLLLMPVWWYTKGFGIFLRGLYESALSFDVAFGWSIWVKNMFTPLYGQTDFVGRVFSFFLRLVNSIVRGVALLVVIVFHLGLLFAWLVGPIWLVTLLV